METNGKPGNPPPLNASTFVSMLVNECQAAQKQGLNPAELVGCLHMAGSVITQLNLGVQVEQPSILLPGRRVPRPPA